MGAIGSKFSKYGQCSAVTGLITTSFILGLIGLVLLFVLPIIGTVAGLAFLAVAFVLGIIALGMLGNILYKQGWNAQNRWCKANIVTTVIIIIVIIALLVTGTVKHINDNQPGSPIPSNDATTQPATQN